MHQTQTLCPDALSGDGQTIKIHTVLPGGKEKDCFDLGNDVT